MELKKYLFDLPQHKRQEFAEKVGTTAKHLINVAYGYRTLDPIVCLNIERMTDGEVSRKALRPNDFWRIWPDLAQSPTTYQPAVQAEGQGV